MTARLFDCLLVGVVVAGMWVFARGTDPLVVVVSVPVVVGAAMWLTRRHMEATT